VAAVGYQVLWSKFLLDFIGVSAYSYATALAFFMGGLALGSHFLGRAADRVRSPLRLFASLELAVAMYGAAYPFLNRTAAHLYERLVRAPDYDGGTAGLGAKALVAGLLLLPPTILMGGTFPAMLRHAARALGSPARQSARLYAVNAAGSVVGALLMAFVLIPGIGMRGSLLAMGALNLAAAAGAFSVSFRRPAPQEAASRPDRGLAPQEAASDPTAAPIAPAPRGGWARLLLLAGAGFVSFACEIAWTRYYGLVLGSSTYSFAVIVAAFITGIAAGSAWLGSRKGENTHPFRFFGWTQILAGLAVLGPLFLYPYLPWLVGVYRNLWVPQPATFILYEGGKLLFCFTTLLVPTFLMGMSVPLVLSDSARGLDGLGREAGRVYAWNTWGNVVGALAAGHVLLPHLGMEGLLRVSALLAGLVGFAAVWVDLDDGPRRRRSIAASALTLVCLVVLNFATPRWDPDWLSLSAFRAPSISWAQAKTSVERSETLLFVDDPAANLLVTRRLGANGHDYTLFVNGKPDASSFGDMPTQVLSAHVPLLLAPTAGRVLIIGLASGVTAGAALRHPVSRVDAVDIVGAMPAATAFFERWNGNPFKDPRFHLVVDDARSYVSLSARTYDLVISEPSNPWMAGTGGLFSTDFYAKARRVMSADGVYVQWVQAYEMGDQSFAAVVRSFRRAFPFVYGFQANASDLILLGSGKALHPDWTEVAARFARPAVRDHLAGLAIGDLGVLLALQRFSPATIDEIAALDTMENDDDNRFLEHRAPRDLFSRHVVTLLDRFDERAHASPSLMWHEVVSGQERPGRALDTLRALSDPRLRVPAVVEAWRVAAIHLAPSALSEVTPGARAVFPAQWWADAPPRREELSGRMALLLDGGASDIVDSVLAAYSTPILLEAALSRESAHYWRGAVSEWQKRGRGHVPLRRLWIDLLAASGAREEAAQELRAWVADRVPPPVDWMMQRACRLDPAELCTWALARARQSDARERVERLQSLRSWRSEGPAAD